MFTFTGIRIQAVSTLEAHHRLFKFALKDVRRGGGFCNEVTLALQAVQQLSYPQSTIPTRRVGPSSTAIQSPWVAKERYRASAETRF